MPDRTPDDTHANTLWFMDTRVTMHLPQAANAGGVSIMEHRMHGGFGPPLHVHHNEDETFYVLEGEFRFVAGGAVRHAGPGETVHVPRGVPHGFRVLSADGGRFLTVTAGGFEQMVRDVSRPAASSGMPERIAEPTPAMQAVLAASSTRNGIDLVGPPVA